MAIFCKGSALVMAHTERHTWIVKRGCLGSFAQQQYLCLGGRSACLGQVLTCPVMLTFMCADT